MYDHVCLCIGVLTLYRRRVVASIACKCWISKDGCSQMRPNTILVLKIMISKVFKNTCHFTNKYFSYFTNITNITLAVYPRSFRTD